MIFVAPGQVFGVEDDGSIFQPRGHVLLFHPDIIHGTSLGQHIRDYSFFSYRSNEALHLSETERRTVLDSLDKIAAELAHPADRHSKRLISINIEVLLDYCLRFYERQFVTRRQANQDVLVRFEQFLYDYFEEDHTLTESVPTVRRCAEELYLSPNYFGDLVKRETGRTAQEYIQQHLIETAKERILDLSKSISEVAYSLGFQYPQHFTRLFKRIVGQTPNEYRNAHRDEIVIE